MVGVVGGGICGGAGFVYSCLNDFVGMVVCLVGVVCWGGGGGFGWWWLDG